jgi:hypothetical protein
MQYCPRRDRPLGASKASPSKSSGVIETGKETGGSKSLGIRRGTRPVPPQEVYRRSLTENTMGFALWPVAREAEMGSRTKLAGEDSTTAGVG